MFVDDRDIHFLSKQQATNLLKVCKNLRTKAIILLMLDAGLRVSEAVSLKFSNFDFKNRVLTIKSLKKRTVVKFRQIPLSERLFITLADYIKSLRNVNPDSWLFPSPKNNKNHIGRFSVNKFLTRKNEKLNISRLHPHVLRNTFATGLFSGGMSLNEVSTLLGHEKLDTTRIYTHIPAKRMEKSIQRFSSDYDNRPWWQRIFKRKLPAIYIPQTGTSSIIGRDTVMQQITDHINKCTNVCVIGPEGVGKKSLLDAVLTDKKVLTFDDISGIKKSLVYLLIYLYNNNLQAVKDVLFQNFDTGKMETKLSRQTVSTLCEEIKKVCDKKEYILKIKSIENVTPSSMKAIELLKDHFIIITAAKEIPINKDSFLWNFEKIKISNLSRKDAFTLIHKLSYDLEIEDFELYRNHIMEQTDGNPRAIVEMIDRYRHEPVLLSDVIRSVTHRGPVRDIDFSFVVIIFIASMAIFRYMTSEFDNPGLRVIGGMAMILLLLSRFIFSRAKRRYV